MKTLKELKLDGRREIESKYFITMQDQFAWLDSYADKIARKVYEACLPKEDTYYFAKDDEDTDREDACEIQYETLAEAEAGGFNSSRRAMAESFKRFME